MISQLLLALVPIALLIALGWWLRQRGFLPESFWPQAERLGYYILLPSLFLHALATARLEGVPVLGMIAALLCAQLLVAAVLVGTRRHLGVGNAAFTSIFQGSVRFNSYVGVSASVGLFGSQGLALGAVATAVLVPTVNILCVLVFARYGTMGTPSWRDLLKQLVTNPLIASCVIGIMLYATGLGLPPGLDGALKALGQASLPLGLLCVGAALDFSTVRSWVRPVAISSWVKFLLMPLCTVAACRLFGLHGPAALAALMFQALPTASSSYILARQLGGDAPLMAGIIASQTLLAALALPLVMIFLTGWM